MYIIYYNTKYTKDILWVVINAETYYEAVDKFFTLIPEATEITGIRKEF